MVVTDSTSPSRLQFVPELLQIRKGGFRKQFSLWGVGQDQDLVCAVPFGNSPVIAEVGIVFEDQRITGGIKFELGQMEGENSDHQKGEIRAVIGLVRTSLSYMRRRRE